MFLCLTTAALTPLPAALVSSCARPEASSKLAAALAELTSLRLLSKATRGGQQEYLLHPSFQAQLRHAMCCGCVGGAVIHSCTPGRHSSHGSSDCKHA